MPTEERTKRDDGGSAFPLVSADGRDENQGMSLRDYFAAAALPTAMNGQLWASTDEASVAALAYRMADAMIAERNK